MERPRGGKEQHCLREAEEGKVCPGQRQPGGARGEIQPHTYTKGLAFFLKGMESQLRGLKEKGDIIRFIGIKDHAGFP